jgi:hypothetical protein
MRKGAVQRDLPSAARCRVVVVRHPPLTQPTIRSGNRLRRPASFPHV